jgi:hypothetical protein
MHFLTYGFSQPVLQLLHRAGSHIPLIEPAGSILFSY